MRGDLGRLLGYIGKYRAPVALSALSAVFAVACTLAAPLVVGGAVDRMTAGGVDFQALARTLLLLALLYLGGSLFQWLLAFLTNRIAYRTVNRLRDELFERLSVLPLSFFDRTPRGDTVSRFINDADIVSDGLLQGLMTLLQGAATIAGAAAVMLWIDPGMALAVILSAPAAFFTARFITLRSQSLFREQARQLGGLNGYAEELIGGMETVRAFCYENRAMERFSAANRKLYDTGFRAQFISALSNPSTRIVNNIAYAAVGVIGGYGAITGKVTVGEVTSFLIFSTIFAKPFNDITNVLTQIQAAAASAGRIFHVLDLEPEPPGPEGGPKEPPAVGRVQFRDVSFSYRPGQRLIEHFNLEVEPGSRIAIVGRTGAGKTTLVNLLMRFYDVDGGAILVDGTDIRNMPRDSLRARFGMVLQDTWLFAGTIRENIAYARPEAPPEEVVRAAKAAGADGFIRRLERGYDTRISGEGDSLSQGQKQLLTIARVMLANPPMLILDEATSSIDTSTELRVQRAFDRLTEGRTSFVIAHRLSTVKHADRILVMDRGRIVESGSHRELLERGGYYAALYNSQFAGPEAETAG